MKNPNPTGAPTAALVVIALAATVLYALSGLKPPRPADPDGAALLERLRGHVAALAGEPHPLGSPANLAQRDRLAAYFRDLGLATQVQRTSVVYDHPRHGTAPSRVAWAENVVARLPGTGARGTLAVMSHYDSVAYGPGAGDAAAGVAAVQEAARALAGGPPPRHEVLFVLTDGEEPGLFGAQAFFREHPLAGEVALVLNFEARGSGGPAFLFETSDGNAGLLAAYAAASPHPLASSLSYEIYRRMPNDTDLTIAKAAGKRALNFAFIDGYPDYHAATDTPANLAAGSLYHHGLQAVALARHFADREQWNFGSADATYFNLLPGTGLVRYGQTTALALAVLTLALGIGALWRLGRAGRISGTGVLRGLAAAVLLVLLVDQAFGSFAAARIDAADGWRHWAYLSRHHLYLLGFVLATTGFAIWFLAAALRGFGWRAIACVLLVVIGLGVWADRLPVALITTALAGALLAALRKPIASGDLIAAGWALWVGLLAALAWTVPNASYVATWSLLPPVLLAAVRPRALERTGPALLAALPAVLIWAPLLYSLHLGIGIGAPQLTMALSALVALVAAPALLRAAAWARGGAGAAVFAAGALVIATAWAIEGFDARHPRPSELYYVFDADRGETYWASGDAEPDDWARSVLGEDPLLAPLDRLLPGAERDLWTGIAPAVELSPARIRRLSDEIASDGRSLRFSISSPERAEYVNLWLPAGRVTAARIDGRNLPPPADLATPLWRWRLYGLPEGGAEIALTVSGSEPLPIEITEVAYRWPPGLAPPPRPPASMRAPYSWSDTTIIRSSHSL